MNKKVIGIDVDLTVVDPIPKWIDWYQQQTGHYLLDDLKDREFSLEKLMTNHHDPVLFWKKHDLYDDLLPIPGSVEGITELCNSGFSIVFISHAYPEHYHSKHLFLKRNFKIPFGFISTGDKGYIRPDVMLDDYEFYLDQVKSMNDECLCIKMKTSLNSDSNKYVYKSWNDDIVHFIKQHTL